MNVREFIQESFHLPMKPIDYVSSVRRARLLSLFAACLFLLSPLRESEAFAQSPFNTERVVSDGGNACRGQQECKEFNTRTRFVRAGQSVEIPLQCPPARPYLKGWDASYHEHIALSLSPSRIGKGPALTLIAHNQADALGALKVTLGCGAVEESVTSAMEWTASLPTKALRRSQQ
jgi:hypothetical protein